ncbi:sigma-70 family RNA polymerase sigma factor [Mesorhizobium sp. BE184]|uniref:sigma-70 family RNA polymerase sigma factor n=1 Tax=Mesorhizobium sp. BE184 TaxID=2817714 RepID=UPI0028622743|nr:sigma-70 family RNA polymerase sigma factor [Mesorhizobium sp. BE184]MDR7034532.1 RNA polymerase sigma-70 factor (ECF subfamily) [Mesorhizobium sp. BE184]
MDATSDDDLCTALLVRVAKGDRASLGELFAREAGRLIAVARRILRRSDLAEEAVQDAFVAVWQRASTYDGARGSARAWLTTIVRNRALNMLRDGARLDYVDDDMLEHFGERSADAEAAYAALPDREALKQCLGQLDASRRRSILLAYVVGFTHGEIAADLKAPVGTVKAWIRRGMIALQECLS